MTVRHHTSKNTTKWIVVADRSRARIFAMTEDEPTKLNELEDLVNPAGAMRQSESVSDREGYFGGREGMLEAAEPKTDFAHKTAEPFANLIVAHLEAGRNSQQFGNLILIAAPAFLGMLRQSLPSPLAQLVELEVNKDYTKHPINEIASRLTELRSSQE